MHRPLLRPDAADRLSDLSFCLGYLSLSLFEDLLSPTHIANKGAIRARCDLRTAEHLGSSSPAWPARSSVQRASCALAPGGHLAASLSTAEAAKSACKQISYIHGSTCAHRLCYRTCRQTSEAALSWRRTSVPAPRDAAERLGPPGHPEEGLKPTQ